MRCGSCGVRMTIEISDHCDACCDFAGCSSPDFPIGSSLFGCGECLDGPTWCLPCGASFATGAEASSDTSGCEVQGACGKPSSSQAVCSSLTIYDSSSTAYEVYLPSTAHGAPTRHRLLMKFTCNGCIDVFQTVYIVGIIARVSWSKQCTQTK